MMSSGQRMPRTLLGYRIALLVHAMFVEGQKEKARARKDVADVSQKAKEKIRKGVLMPLLTMLLKIPTDLDAQSNEIPRVSNRKLI